MSVKSAKQNGAVKKPLKKRMALKQKSLGVILFFGIILVCTISIPTQKGIDSQRKWVYTTIDRQSPHAKTPAEKKQGGMTMQIKQSSFCTGGGIEHLDLVRITKFSRKNNKN